MGSWPSPSESSASLAHFAGGFASALDVSFSIDAMSCFAILDDVAGVSSVFFSCAPEGPA